MPYDLTVHDKAIRRHALRQADFAYHPELQKAAKLNAVIEATSKLREAGFKSLPLHTTQVGGKSAYKLKKFEHELALRMVSANIRRLTRVKQGNRASITEIILRLLEEGNSAAIYKVDFKSFYESVDRQTILDELEADMAFSRSTLRILRTFFDQLTAKGLHGLPRGLALSATLSEYYIRNFDRAITSDHRVFYYARFVDDIFILTGGSEDPVKFRNELARALPDGVRLNEKKFKYIPLKEKPIKTNAPRLLHAKFDFLGYEFRVFNRRRSLAGIDREVEVDISQSKTNRIKTKIVRSFLQFLKDGVFVDLSDRMKILAGNYVVYDHARDVKRKAGIYYNYSLADGGLSERLPELDQFLAKLLLSSKGRICSKIYASLSANQRRQLLKMSFVRGFNQRDFYHYPAGRLVDLLDCWKYA